MPLKSLRRKKKGNVGIKRASRQCEGRRFVGKNKVGIEREDKSKNGTRVHSKISAEEMSESMKVRRNQVRRK